MNAAPSSAYSRQGSKISGHRFRCSEALGDLTANSQHSWSCWLIRKITSEVHGGLSASRFGRVLPAGQQNNQRSLSLLEIPPVTGTAIASQRRDAFAKRFDASRVSTATRFILAWTSRRLSSENQDLNCQNSRQLLAQSTASTVWFAAYVMPNSRPLMHLVPVTIRAQILVAFASPHTPLIGEPSDATEPAAEQYTVNRIDCF
jgi:hypothetical protein